MDPCLRPDTLGTGLAIHGDSAMAGIVRCLTLAMVGESGPEAVVPIGQGFGGDIIIIQGDAVIDDENPMGKLVRAIESALSQSARTGLGI